MMDEKCVRVSRLLWSLVFGLSLVTALLWAVTSRVAAEARDVNPGFTLDVAHAAVWGIMSPGDVITIASSADAAVYGAAEADGVGFFWTPLWRDTGRPESVGGDDTFAVYVNGALADTLFPVTITGQLDVLKDRVAGTVEGVSAGTEVTITLGMWAWAPSLEFGPQLTVTTGATGAFTATFSNNDLGPHQYARVEVPVGFYTVQDYLYPQNVFQLNTFSYLMGYATPGRTVTATVYVTETDDVRWSGTAFADWPHGFYVAFNVGAEPGDVAEVDLGSGTVITTLVNNLTAYVDVDNDQVTGTCSPNETVRVFAMNGRLGIYGETSTTADASGNYTATFTGYDLKASDAVYPSFADDEGNEILLTSHAPQIVALLESDAIGGSGYAPGTPYTLTLYHAPDTHVHTGTTALEGNAIGQHQFDDIAAGDVITLENGGWTGVMTVADLSFDVDTAADRVTGQADPGQVLVCAQQWMGWLYPVHSQMGLSTTVSSPFTATFTNFDLRDGCDVQVEHLDANDFATRIERDVHYFQVNVPYGVYAQGVSPDSILTATLYESDGTTVKRQAVQDQPEWDGTWVELEGDVATQDWVTVTDGAGWTAGLQVPTLTIQADPDSELIWGKGPKALVYIEHAREDWSDWFGRFVAVDGYVLNRAFYGGDVQQGDNAVVVYQAPDGNQVRRDLWWPQMRVNYAHEWVGGDYPAGHTFWITVTDGVDASAVVTTTPGGGWGRDGFETQDSEWALGSRPDIASGDTVDFRADDGYTNTIRVGEITGNLDTEADFISGTINAGWFAPLSLTVECNVWHGPQPSINTMAEADGGSYECDFDGLVDIQPGWDVAVMYVEPDGDRVINVFREPAPHLRINKRADGAPAAGGNFVFTIEYWNDGEGAAENAVITDTLLGGMTYLTDTTGLSHTGTGAPGDPLVWELGTVPAQTYAAFDVFVAVTATEGDPVTNTVQIASSNYDEGDPQERESQWSGTVQANDAQLNVGKGAWTGDPAPGYDFVYNVNVCNNGSTDSNDVVLTETLPTSVTLQTWWAQRPGWVELDSEAHQLVLTHPAIAGYHCSEVYLRGYLTDTVSPGDEICNTVVITSTSDQTNGDDETTWCTQVGSPHVNLGVSKEFEFGQLVPGGQLGYQINYGSHGNVPVENVLITDTLPVSTTFARSWRWTEYGEVPVTPTQVTDDYVVWDLGTLLGGQGDNLGVALDVANDAPVGMVLTNTIEISSLPGEGRYDDNTDTWVESLHGTGPNLRVDKYYRWENEDRILYGVYLKNVGTTNMSSIWVTDTYPISTTSDGNLWVGHGPRFTATHDAENRQFVVETEELGPGGTAHFGFWVDLDEAIRGVQGLLFTNTVAAPWPGDVDTADNSDTEVAYTGPEVYVEKWLSGGVPKPGEMVTFTVAFGNCNQDPWSGDDQYESHITDTLPEGMTFLRATAPWNADWQPETQDDNVLAWSWGPMWPWTPLR